MKYLIFLLIIILTNYRVYAEDIIRLDYLFEDKTCYCKVRKTEAFWTFIDTSSMMNILLQWNPSIHNFQSTPWSTVRGSKAPHAHQKVLNYSCDYENEITRTVEYKTMVKAPIFLQTFVNDRLIHQTKQQSIFNCKEEDILIFTENCVIDDIPIIPNININVRTLMRDNSHPVATVTLTHQVLPWYMRFIQNMFEDEVIAKARSLWKITVNNLCQCSSL